jgi:hypothetical protein
MITRAQAQLARSSLAPVFGPDGMEVTITLVTNGGAWGEDNSGVERTLYRFDELTPSRDLLALERREQDNREVKHLALHPDDCGCD